MNSHNLLDAIGEAKDQYILTAVESREGKTRRTGFKKSLLAAMIAAVMLALVGCGVAVYLLSMQNMKLGDQAATKPVFETNGIDIAGYEEINQHVLTLAGLKGSDGYQAALEWYSFKQEYDPDHSIIVQLMADDKVPEFAPAYDSYNLYTQEMKNKLDGILAKYSLKPAGQALNFRSVKNLCTALGIDKIINADNDVTVLLQGGTCWENGNFILHMDFSHPDDGNGITVTPGQIYWNRKDCFSEETITIEDSGDWKEWNYTTASGNDVLIIRSESDWRGWIIYDRPEGTLALRLEARKDLGNNDGEKTWWDSIYMTDRQMELCADAIDFGIQPKVASKEDADNQAGITMEATQDGYTVKLKSVETDGVLGRFAFGITAPEGTVISKQADGSRFDISSSNYDILTPVSGGIRGGSTPMNPQEDGDGLDNTQDVVIEADVTMEDGSKPFAIGTQWNIRFEDLISIDWYSPNVSKTVLAQGEWLFPITIEESFGDFREIELVSQPVAVKACIGWTADGTDVLENVELLSFTLRSMSATAQMNDKSADLFYRGAMAYVVMKDGTQIELDGTMTFKSPIDLTQVDHVLLPDGTKLSAP